MDKTEDCSYSSKTSEEGSAAPGRNKGRLINSASFSGLGNTPHSNGKKESVVNSSHFLNGPHQMIDYRNFVPQMPFVPAVAKTLPRKRISLKRSKKGIRDIFHLKKNKPESLTLLSEKQKRLPFQGGTAELAGRLTKYFFKAGENLSADCLAQDFSDGEMLSESSYEYSSGLCEDIASLKSFDSLTGCGEIFADESSAHMELEVSKEISLRQSKQKENPATGSFQGGVEQLASPAQNEAADFAKLWDNINKSVQLHQKMLFDRKLLKIPSSELGKATSETDTSVIDLLSSPDSSKESSIDTGTPKSDNQESMSTSDEGYYDSFSPGQDDETREEQTPTVPGRFPRDSYSGDALYELFYDPNEAQISPDPDDDLCMSESISEKATEIPLSIYSFHVGSEENMASQPAVDIISQGFLHSTWKGKECLLKLCDTELSLTMGIINWLRKNQELVSPQDFPKFQQEKDNEAILSSPSISLNMNEAAQAENKHQPEVAAVTSKNGTQRYATDKIENQQRDVIASSTPEECSRFLTDNSASCNLQRWEDSWHDLLTSSSETEKVLLFEECIVPCTPVPSLEVLHPDCQTDENPLILDNHDAESCSSYMTAATSPDSLEMGDETETKDQPWSIAYDKPIEPLNFSHSQSRMMSEVPKDRDANVGQLLEHCATQVASLNISYENKHLEDKPIGSEVDINATEKAELKNQLPLQNECICIASSPKDPPVYYPCQCNVKTNISGGPLYLLNQKEGLTGFEDQKNSSIPDCIGPVAQNKLSFEYAQLNNQALSYIKDFKFELSTSTSTAVAHFFRPRFLPFFSSICSGASCDFSQPLSRKASSPEKHSQNGVTLSSTPLCDYSKFQCAVLPKVAALSLPGDAAKEEAMTEKHN
uniref:Uncharacterized protein n=2 Tax=Sphaerodactylus townsendi TaxID=933632 RepID=A0ACB8FA30_9SAUR